MTQIDDILELVRTGVIIPETNVAILAREVEKLRETALKEGEVGVNAFELGALRDLALAVHLPPKGCARALDLNWSWALEAKLRLVALGAST